MPFAPWHPPHTAAFSLPAFASPLSAPIRRKSTKSSDAADAIAPASRRAAQTKEAIRRGRHVMVRSSLQLDVQKKADQVRAVALRTAVGIDAMVDDLAVCETGVVPVIDTAALVVVEDAQRDAPDDRDRRADREPADVV